MDIHIQVMIKKKKKKCRMCDNTLGSHDFLSSECKLCYYDEGDI